ncbi:MAG TPA: tRNA (guanosine(46)-N7)-methyltransferase TrmB [Rhodospirillaceae bacterium]|nr:tRNA (guanosine(46)-N7)-methyltransferase TrmB [Rhodospirillaceae bacterium]|tara:strand:+ start:2412 stop:3098 length:687 start_codon:yes stop_codon:yes gene_type:complete
MNPEEQPRFYGRRRGKKLRPGRSALVADLLPTLRVPAGGGPLDPAGLFDGEKSAYWMEIGFGAGEHLADQAQAHPDIGFIGCEPFVNGVATLLAQITDRSLDNIRLHDDDARQLLPRLAPGSIDRVYLLYSDPWPKKRHWNRRFVQRETLDQLARILAPGGLFRFATDHMGHARWALGLAANHPEFEWTARGPEDWRIRWADGYPTRYEEKGLAGPHRVYLEFRRRGG